MGKIRTTLNLLNQLNARYAVEKVSGLFLNISRVKYVQFNLFLTREYRP